ncbi:hypothetical protein BD779DRAFT_358231 [Infundibulicybe gibba]|nr:hypothetical protein BD779DRAFT_358231 [Infundibulicybe gibba]
MAYPAYSDGYDGYGRGSISRRQSIAYGGPPVAYPYSDQPGMYSDGMGDYPQPSYQIYAPSNTVAMNHRLTGPSYEDLAMRDPYYDERPMSTAPVAPIMHHSTSMGMPRHRRHSTVSFSARPPPMETYRRPSSINIKFKRKGAFTAGISLREAQSHVRLSGNDSYSIHDLHADGRGRILLKVKWTGYSSLTYEIPLDSYDGRMSLTTLARRVSRACVHYLQANIIPIAWDRVELHHLEEVSFGVWQPMLSTR